MKLILTFCLVWTVLHTAETLQCLSCNNVLDPNCTQTSSSTCSADQMCLTATVAAPVLGGFNASGVKKACAPTTLCSLGTGSTEASLNLGFGRIAVAFSCCNTDNCNSNNLPAPLAVANGLQCSSCTNLTNLSDGLMCQNSTACYGQEAACFRGSLSINSVGYTGLGCASALTCAAVSLLPSITGLSNFGASISCCPGNLCNKQNPSTTTLASTTATTQNPSTAATVPSTAATQTASTAATTPTTATKPTTVNTTSAATRLLAAGGPLLLITFILF